MNGIDLQSVKFKVVKIEDTRKVGSVLDVGIEYTGTLSGRTVLWTDPGSGQDWSFYIDGTCQIIVYG